MSFRRHYFDSDGDGYGGGRDRDSVSWATGDGSSLGYRRVGGDGEQPHDIYGDGDISYGDGEGGGGA
jgi:hypothetical protein